MRPRRYDSITTRQRVQWRLQKESQREDTERAAAFICTHGLPFQVLMDREGVLKEPYDVLWVPTTVLVDAEGVICSVCVGTMTAKTLRSQIQALLGKGK
ncbi:MAG TPA: redoxin domain-containing protein [Chloroflexi bacterium]|nr:redoxin domain-containing protein [Chloroflexota bacterium]